MDKIGRNDTCPCGSGKKYKNCCFGKKIAKKKLSAKWINAPQVPNLLTRTFDNAIGSATSFAKVEYEENALQISSIETEKKHLEEKQ